MAQCVGSLKLNLVGLSADEKRFVRSEAKSWQSQIDRHRLTVKKAGYDLRMLLNALHAAHDSSLFGITIDRTDDAWTELENAFAKPQKTRKP